MGRYSAPLLDDDSQCSAMDWTATPDENDILNDVMLADRRDEQSFVDDSSEHQNQVVFDVDAERRRDPFSLIPFRSCNSTNYGSSHDEASATIENLQEQDTSAEESRNGGNTFDSDLHDCHENHPSSRIYDQRDAFHLAQQFLQHSQFMQQQYFEARTRKRRKYVIAASILALIVAFVLERYAPPPPPTVVPAESTMDGDYSSSTRSMLVEETMTSSSHAHFPGEKMNGERIFVRHHEDWRSYCRHVFALIFHIVYYDVLSVAWYATLNSLFYAAEETKYWLVQSIKALCGNVINSVRGENVQCNNSSGRLLACWRHRIWEIIGRKTMNTHHNQPSPPFSENMSSYHHQEEVSIPLSNPHDHQSTNKPACFIRLPAARNTQLHLPRGAIPPTRSAFNNIIFEGLSTDEAINQFGVQLPPQSLAVKLIAEGVNSWGRDIFASASAPLVHLLATGWRSDNKRNSKDKTSSSELMFPPATGMLLVGPEGVGKLHLSRSVARVLLDHCSAFDQNEVLNHQSHRDDDPSCLDYSEENTCSGTTLQSIATVGSSLDGVLEILAEDYAHLSANDIIDRGDEDERSSRLRRQIVEHIRIRESVGSVIIIQHIEDFPIPLLSDISKVLSGKSNTLSYNTSEGTVKATCNGALFLFTSRKWGSRSIFRQIQMNDGIAGLHRERLISSIRREVDSQTDMQLSNVSK